MKKQYLNYFTLLFALFSFAIVNAQCGSAPFTESFGTGSLPACHTTSVTSGSGWDFNGISWNGYCTGPTGSGNNYMSLDFSTTGGGNDVGVIFEMGDVDVTGVINPYLEFDHYMCDPNTYTPNEVFVEAYNGATWDQIALVDVGTGSWETYGYSLNAFTYGASLVKIRFRAEYNGNTSTCYRMDIAIDEISIAAGSSCVSPPTTAFTVVEDCVNGFTVDINVTNMGSATSFDIMNGGSSIGTINATGVTNVGPFTNGTPEDFILVHNSDAGCNVEETGFVNAPCPPINNDCANATSLTLYGFGLGAGNETAVNSSLATASAMALTSCDGVGTNIDLFFEFTMPLGETGMNVTTSVNREFALYDGCSGIELECEGLSSSNDFTGLIPGNTYILQVWTDNTGGAYDIVLELLAPPPANNNCLGATALTVNTDLACSSVTAGTIENANASGENETACSGTENDDVWYSFVATATGHGIELLNITGTTTSLNHSVWEGVCGSLTLIPGSCSFSNTSIVSGLTIGNLYYVRIYSSGSGSYNTTFDVCVGTPPPPPVNSDCVGALNLTVYGFGLGTGNETSENSSDALSSSMASTSCDNDNNNIDMFYTFTMPLGETSVNVITSAAREVALYNVCAGPELDCQSNGFFHILTGLTPGIPYTLQVWSDLTGGAYDIVLELPAPPPANDDCLGATGLTVNADYNCGSVSAGTILSATASSENIVSCSGDENDDVWYSFMATATTHRIQILNITGSNTNIDHSLWEGSCGSLTIVSGSCATGTTSNVSGLTIGNTYFVRVYSFTGNSETTTFDVCVGTQPPPPVNDVCAGALNLIPYTNGNAAGNETSVDQSQATASPLANTSCDAAGTNYDMFYTFTMPAGATEVNVSTSVSKEIALFDACGGTELFCNSTSLTSNDLTGLTPGATYTLQVWKDFAQGAYDIVLELPPPPPANDDCSVAINLTVYGVGLGAGNELAQNGTNATASAMSHTSCDATGTNIDMFYTFTMPAGATEVHASTSASTEMALYDACLGTELDCKGIAFSNDFSGLTPGTTYLLQVYNDNTGKAFDILLELLPSSAFVWNGTTSTDYHTSSNWSTGTVPTSADEIIIPDLVTGNYPLTSSDITVLDLTTYANASLTIGAGSGLILASNGTVTNNGTVTLKDGAYLDDFTNAAASFVGDISVERLVSNGAGNDQRFISSAVNTPNVSEIGDDLNGPWGLGLPGADGVAVTIDDCALQTTASSSNYGNLFEFDETLIATCALDGWVVRSAGSLANGAGYSAYLTSGSTFEMNGVPNTGDVIIPVTNSGSAVAAGEGWNLIGNPYPSPISRDDVINAGVTDAQYYEASGPYQGTFTPYMPTSNIAIAQGFQVQTAATGNVTLTDAMRNVGLSNWYSNSSWFTHKLDVIVSGNNFADKTILFYNDDATNNYEAIYDVVKRPSALGQPTLSSFSANKELALNGMPVNTLGEAVPVNFEAGTNGSFALSFEGMETFGNTTIYVRDLQENVVHNITDGDYAFTSTTSDNEGRFEIIFVPEVDFTATKVDCEMNDANLTLANLNFVANRTFELLANNVVVNTGNLADLNTVELEEGNYTLNVVDQFGGSQNYDVVIESAEIIEASLEVSNTEVFVGDVIALNNTTSNATAVVWSTENSTIGSVNNLTYSFDEAGTYEIEMMVSNAECSDMKTVVIEVANKTTAIETVDGQKINFYPNPATDVLHIESDVNVVIEMIDILGKTLIKTSNKQISLEDIPTGVYFLKIYNENNKLIGSEKVIKK